METYYSGHYFEKDISQEQFDEVLSEIAHTNCHLQQSEKGFTMVCALYRSEEDSYTPWQFFSEDELNALLEKAKQEVQEKEKKKQAEEVRLAAIEKEVQDGLNKQRKEERDRSEYERLKAKFEKQEGKQ